MIIIILCDWTTCVEGVFGIDNKYDVQKLIAPLVYPENTFVNQAPI